MSEQLTHPSAETALAYVARLERLPLLYRRLRETSGVAAMLAAAADLVRVECDVARSLVLIVGEDGLTADGMHALSDPASDRLRRRVQGASIALVPGTLEHQLVRRTSSKRRGSPPSLLAEALGLTNYAYGVIAPESGALALLVVDRPERPLEALEERMVNSVTEMVGITLEHLVLGTRMAEVAMELRNLSSSAQALMTEVLHSPLTIPVERGHGTAFPRSRRTVGTAGTSVRELLTAREIEVAALLVQGRSNREIGAELIISTATVKDCIVRIRRKLQATNRVDAAARYLQLTQAADDALT